MHARRSRRGLRCAPGQRAGDLARRRRVRRSLGHAPAARELAAGSGGEFSSRTSTSCSLANGYRFFAPEPGPEPPGALRTDARRRHAQDRANSPIANSTSRDCSITAISCSASSSIRWRIPTLRATGPRPTPGAMPSTWPSTYGARSVQLYLRRHFVPRTSEVRQGMRLDRQGAVRRAPAGHLSRETSHERRPGEMSATGAREIVAGWNRFWFQPTDPATLGLIRICAGAMLFYTHLVWSLDLTAFFGPARLAFARGRRLAADATPTRGATCGGSRFAASPVDGPRRGARRLCPVHRRAVQPRRVGPGAGRHAVLRGPRSRRAVWSRSDQRHAGDVPGRRTLRRRLLARSLAQAP